MTGPDTRLFPANPLVAASVACLRGDRVLLASRARPPARGLFSLPGGLVEPGEPLADAALRELREETGIVADQARPLPPIEHIERDPDGRVRRHFVICPHVACWRSGEGLPGPEAERVAWLLADELASVPTTAGLVAIVRAAFALRQGLDASGRSGAFAKSR